MLGDVFEQGDLIVEALVAGVALVRLVSLVARCRVWNRLMASLPCASFHAALNVDCG